MRSKVFFADIRAVKEQDALVRKLKRLFEISGAQDIIKRDDIVAVKIHFGEWGNERSLRPGFVRTLVDCIKEAGGRPFVMESIGMGWWLQGGRASAFHYLATAAKHGFTTETMGAPIIIAGGFKGLSGTNLKINGIELKEVSVVNEIFEADKIILATHFKGHSQASMGGALKNLGTGCASKRGKAQQHARRPQFVIPEKCNGCGACREVCPFDAIRIARGKASIDPQKCWMGDQACQFVCKPKAIELEYTSPKELSHRIVDTAAAIIRHMGKDKFAYFNFLLDITAHCDCCAYSDLPIVPDIGILASKDPVAIDRASIDLVNASTGIPKSLAEEANVLQAGVEKLNAVAPLTQTWLEVKQPVDWKWQLNAAKKLKLGNDRYELIKI
jgi:uncharacterized Fe-S center protein